MKFNLLRKTSLSGLLLLVALSQVATARDMGMLAQTGAGQRLEIFNGVPVTVYTYRPPSCTQTTPLIIFAGYSRTAAKYRNRAIPLARRACLLVVAPLLDRRRFPNWRYHRVGTFRKGRVQPRKKWTGPLIDVLPMCKTSIRRK